MRVGIGRVGAHRLRHTLAAELLRRGSTIIEVSQVLRHRDLATTAIYAKVDLDTLRQVARPWPGVQRWCAGINRQEDGDERALHRRGSDPRWPRVMRRCP
ncbi:MAG: tyrosine-type recombinase/integrase [Acidimicrobiia bacterium]